MAEMLEKRAELARKRLTVDDFKEAAEVGLTVEVTESGSVKVVDVEKVPIAKG